MWFEVRREGSKKILLDTVGGFPEQLAGYLQITEQPRKYQDAACVREPLHLKGGGFVLVVL